MSLPVTDNFYPSDAETVSCDPDPDYADDDYACNTSMPPLTPVPLKRTRACPKLSPKRRPTVTKRKRRTRNEMKTDYMKAAVLSLYQAGKDIYHAITC